MKIDDKAKTNIIRISGSILFSLLGVLIGNMLVLDVLFAICLSLDFNLILSLILDIKKGTE